ncbi:MAG TPA: hypothetical protein VF611_05340, partial [Pyrinomonadaceae bacterium]
MAYSGHKPWAVRASLMLAALLASSSLLLPATGAARQAGAEDAGFLSLALPPGGEVVVENRRGGVRVEVWGEEQVGLAASVGQAAAAAPRPAPRRTPRRRAAPEARLPVSVERAGETLKITVLRAATAGAPRVDLSLRVPAGARLKVNTSDGGVNVLGLPASLDAQTLSGDLRLALPARAAATLTAQTLPGSVAVGAGVEAGGAAGRVLRGKFQARLGAGGSVVKLFSGRGRISLDALAGNAGIPEAAR